MAVVEIYFKVTVPLKTYKSSLGPLPLFNEPRDPTENFREIVEHRLHSISKAITVSKMRPSKEV